MAGLLDRGHDVRIFAGEPPETPVEHEIIRENNLLNRVVYSEPPHTHVEGLKQLGTVVPFLLFHGHSPHNICSQFRHGTAAPELLGKIREFYRHAGDEDVLHAHFGPTANSFLPAQEVTQSPLVASFYGYDISGVPRSNPSVYDKLFERATAITCLSDDMKKDIVALGGPATKIRKVPLCIDIDKFEYRERSVGPSEPIRILTVARHVEKKGLRYAVDAVAKLDIEQPVTYLIAGDGPRREQLEGQIAELDADDRIEILGWQTQEEISRLMADVHMFLLPSVTAENGDKEGTPTVLLEAQSTGLPVVSTTHAGIPEIVSDGKSGLLVPERDVDALINALETILSQPKRWPEMGQAGREHVEAHHSIDVVTERIITIYRDVA